MKLSSDLCTCAVAAFIIHSHTTYTEVGRGREGGREGQKEGKRERREREK